ncbi:lipopolysaccharide core heptose(I) kinase RfaP [Pseudomonas sp. NFR16]|uniref:lipopolysaccharide core heptose(I) kinase RfaP n=1 Tax=Pseudomonas sp. NFR16 TaxID=1566248 RepID=UPI000B87A119|nr:lipopolysaccharide core heptose(I) kinase RfaP [Pseudomonas sp. NFR16]
MLSRRPALVLAAPFNSLWSEEEAFDRVNALSGEEFRNVAGRRTFRIELANTGYFVKIHRGVGWGEIFKNLVTGKLPVVGATSEFRAATHLKQFGVSTLTVGAFGAKGFSPARTESFLVTEEIAPAVDLEVLTKSWKIEPPSFVFKHSLIGALARLIRDMHEAGVNHRDCYLCHFLLHSDSLSGMIRLSVIDLHRAQIRQSVTGRWMIKDLAGLAFSALDIGLTQRDYLRFLMMYFESDAGSIFEGRRHELEAIKLRLEKFARRKNKYGDLL